MPVLTIGIVQDYLRQKPNNVIISIHLPPVLK